MGTHLYQSPRKRPQTWYVSVPKSFRRVRELALDLENASRSIMRQLTDGKGSKAQQFFERAFSHLKEPCQTAHLHMQKYTEHHGGLLAEYENTLNDFFDSLVVFGMQKYVT